jgi:hypothetical protein
MGMFSAAPSLHWRFPGAANHGAASGLPTVELVMSRPNTRGPRSSKIEARSSGGCILSQFRRSFPHLLLPLGVPLGKGIPSLEHTIHEDIPPAKPSQRTRLHSNASLDLLESVPSLQHNQAQRSTCGAKSGSPIRFARTSTDSVDPQGTTGTSIG